MVDAARAQPSLYTPLARAAIIARFPRLVAVVALPEDECYVSVTARFPEQHESPTYCDIDFPSRRRQRAGVD